MKNTKSKSVLLRERILILVRMFITVLIRENKNHKKEEPQLRELRVEAPGLVRVTRLELVRHGHTPLKRACLPIPAHSHLSCQIIISNLKSVVNKNFN